MLTGNIISLNAFLKNLKRSHMSDLRAHLKALEQKETDIPRRSRPWNNQTEDWNEENKNKEKTLKINKK